MGRSKHTNYRLLKEDEWEYAARAGSANDYSLDQNGNEVKRENLADYAVFNEDWNTGSPHNVGEKLPNKFGLKDMHGNVWEWCEDLWDSKYADRVIRGGGWSNVFHLPRSLFLEKTNSDPVFHDGIWYHGIPNNLRSAYRNFGNPDNSFKYVGVRFARTPKKK